LTNERTAATNTTYLTYRVNNAVPNQLTMSGLRFYNADYTRYTALHAQEQWTSGRWTLQGAVRYDNAWRYTPDLQVGPSKWNPIPQDLRTSGGDFCGVMSNLNFGKSVFSNTYDPALLTGWGKRPSDWSLGASVMREVLPRVSLEVGYFRRWWGNFVVTDNLAV